MKQKKTHAQSNNKNFISLIKPLAENLLGWWIDSTEAIGANLLKLSKNPTIPEELKTTNATTLYRGLQIKERSLTKILDGGRLDLKTFSVSSWTPDKNVAMQFAEHATGDYSLASVIMYKKHFSEAIVFDINKLYDYLQEQLLNLLNTTSEELEKSSFTKQDVDKQIKDLKKQSGFSYQNEVLLDCTKAKINLLDLLELTSYKYPYEGWKNAGSSRSSQHNRYGDLL